MKTEPSVQSRNKALATTTKNYAEVWGTGQFPPEQLPARQLPPDNCLPDNCYLGQLPPEQFPTRTIAPGQLFPRQLPPDNSHLGKLPPDNCTRTISSNYNWTHDQITPGHFPSRTIPTIVIAFRRLWRLKNFYCLSFGICTIRYFININMHFFKAYDRFPFRIISENGWWRLFFDMSILNLGMLIWACPKFNL